MSIFDDLGALIKPIAPVVGGLVAGPAGAAVATLIASRLGGDPEKPEELIKIIKQDPDAAMKLQQLQLDQRVELEKIALQYAMIPLEEQRLQNADVADARDQNNKNHKLVDDVIKAYLVVFISAIMFLCLYALIEHDLNPQESTVMVSIVSSAFTAVLGMTGFYWGAAQDRKKGKKLNV